MDQTDSTISGYLAVSLSQPSAKDKPRKYDLSPERMPHTCIPENP